MRIKYNVEGNILNAILGCKSLSWESISFLSYLPELVSPELIFSRVISEPIHSTELFNISSLGTLYIGSRFFFGMCACLVNLFYI